MPVAPSFQDLLDVGEAELKNKRADLLAREGDVSLAMLHVAAAMNDAVIRYGAQAFRETFIDGAKGDALTALVDDHMNLQRQPATAAQVTVEFTRASGGSAGTFPAGTVIATNFDADGREIRFETDSDLIVGTTDTTVSVSATCTETGTDGNVAAGTIVRVINQPSFDDSWTVTNPDGAAGGNDEERDEDLRERARSYFRTLRRGTLAALEFGARQVTSVRYAKAVEDEAGIVTVRVTDEDGNSTALMVSDVEAEMENWRAAGSIVHIVGGSSLSVDLTVRIAQARAGFSATSRASEIQDAVSTRVNKLRPGETLYLDMVIAAVIAVSPDEIYDVEIDDLTVGGVSASSIVDVVPASGEAIRVGTVTVL